MPISGLPLTVCAVALRQGGSAGFHITVFELSYQERAAPGRCRKRREVEQEFHRECID